MRNEFRRENLSASDVLNMNDDVERVIALGKWTPRTVKHFVVAILPLFKWAYVNHRVDGIGRPVVRMNAEQWKTLTKTPEYVGIREALGWFEHTDDRPMATIWTLLPVLTMDSPWSLGSTWDIMVMHARKAKRRPTRKKAEGKDKDAQL